MSKQTNENAKPLQVEFNAPLKQLMLKVKKQGYCLTDDLLAVIPESEENMAQLEEIFIQFITQGLKVYSRVEEADEDQHPKAAQQDRDTVDPGVAPFDLSAVAADNTLGLYIKEMAQVPLLTPVEEIALAKQLERGRKAEKGLKKVPYDSEEAVALRAVVAAGHKARNHLINANTRLVISIAKKYRGQKNIPFSDLIQEGNLGLIKAVEKFDYRRGYRFSTYATWWIRQAVTRAMDDQGRTIRVPVHMSDRIRKLYQVSGQFELARGRKPTAEELALEMNLKPAIVRWMLRVSRHPVSLERPVGEEKDSELGNLIEDEDAPAPPDAAAHHLLCQKLEDMLDTLTPREARILRLRFGLQNGHSHTLEEIGQKFGLTRERIRQIERRALHKLRHPRRARSLKDYLT
jgi:RNA polymerase primary sigma factor